jgi:hypothetical protein
MPEQSALHSGGAGGVAGGPCVAPPSAKATPNRETMRMEIATNRLSCVIVLFVLSLKVTEIGLSDRDVIERANNNTASNHNG